MIAGCNLKYFQAEFDYMVASSLRVDPGVEAFCLSSVVRGNRTYKDI